jgi:hypothetical protein
MLKIDPHDGTVSYESPEGPGVCLITDGTPNRVGGFSPEEWIAAFHLYMDWKNGTHFHESVFPTYAEWETTGLPDVPPPSRPATMLPPVKGTLGGRLEAFIHRVKSMRK